MTEEEKKEDHRRRSKAWYYRKKEAAALAEKRKEALLKSYNLPSNSGIYKSDCCVICKHFSKIKGTNTGWCMKIKKSVNKKDICGEFNPITEEKFTQVIYKTPGVKNVKGNY